MLSGTWLVVCNGPFFSPLPPPIKLTKCQGRQGEGMGAGSDAAVCTLRAHCSSAGIHQMDACGCQLLNKPRFEGERVEWAELSKVCQCLWVSGFLDSYRAPCWAGHLIARWQRGRRTAGGAARRKWHRCRVSWSVWLREFWWFKVSFAC